MTTIYVNIMSIYLQLKYLCVHTDTAYSKFILMELFSSSAESPFVHSKDPEFSLCHTKISQNHNAKTSIRIVTKKLL